MRQFVGVIVLLHTILSVSAQDFPKYGTPLEHKAVLVSTFGELRANHFHSGLDFSTGGKEGIPVVALDDGYVSRISISADGYGNALYITYTNGYKSVYGHLKKFAGFIDSFVVDQQYLLKSFQVKLYPLPGQLPVKKGQVLGYVGNTGRSYAPHLHFEMRRAYDDLALNPLYFGLGVGDHRKPQIRRFAIYPATDSSFVAGKHKPMILTTNYAGRTFTVQGPVYFAVEAYDFTDGHYSKKGVYGVKLFIDDTLVFAYKFDSLSFENTRYINALLDYRQFKAKKIKLQKSFVAPNNRLNFYQTDTNGVFYLTDGRHKIRYYVYDFFGNYSTITFYVLAQRSQKTFMHDSTQRLFSWNRDNSVILDSLNLFIPAYALYDTAYMSVKKIGNGEFSAVYQVGSRFVPLQSAARLSIKVNDKAKDYLDKLLLIRRDGDIIISAGGGYKDGYVRARIYSLGQYYVGFDTIAPSLKILSDSVIVSNQKIFFKVKDDLTGLYDYVCTVNGQWHLAGFDAKTSKLYIVVDNKFVQGENIVQFVLKDGRDNVSRYKFVLYLK